jgi:hypothetical protein
MDELVAANQVLWDFLVAVRSGDEATAARLYYPASAQNIEAAPGNVARRFLEQWQVPPDELERLAVVHAARLLDGLVAFGIIPRDPAVFGIQMIDGPTPARALALIQVPGEPGWQVWGTPDLDEWKRAEVVALPPPAVGPTH